MDFRSVTVSVANPAFHHQHPAKPKVARSYLLFSGVALLAIIACQNRSYAADFTVITPTIITNGSAANILDGNDSLTITSSGEIIVTGANAVDATGIENVITNDGKISTIGNGASGIDVDGGNMVTNSGTITTIGSSAEGIEGNNDNVATNNGTILTYGNNSYGIRLNSDAFITNSGSIEVTGDDANFHGIDVTSGDVLNSGSVITSGANTDAIQAERNNTVTNSGKVVSAGSRSFHFEEINFNDGGRRSQYWWNNALVLQQRHQANRNV